MCYQFVDILGDINSLYRWQSKYRYCLPRPGQGIRYTSSPTSTIEIEGTWSWWFSLQLDQSLASWQTTTDVLQCSSWRPVWSGVLQGSVLGQVLFLIFINDSDTGLSSKISKFADVTKIFRPVMNHTDGLGLQQDLDSISNWARRWQMEFNVSKCKVMHFGKGNIRYRYIMDKQLEASFRGRRLWEGFRV